MSKLSISGVMTRVVVSISPEMPVRDVVSTVREKRISCVMVCDGDLPIGIITERDLVRSAWDYADKGGPRNTAREMMTSPVLCIPEAMPLSEALALARARKVRHLPVTDGAGRLAGIVTQTDLLNAYLAHVEELVRVRTEELVLANQKLEELSLRDGLLGIGNRRALDEALPRIHDTALRYDRPYSLALFDVDHFKKYNDHYGHVAGDDALRQVARRIADTARVADHVYRYGGEELVVLFPETPLERARLAVQRMVESVRLLAIPHQDSPLGHVTVSAGVDGVEGKRGAPEDWRDLVRAVDEKLYRAKQSGRDRLV